LTALTHSLAILRAVFSLCLLLVFAGWAFAVEPVPQSAVDPRITIHDGFADEKTCASCHDDQAAAFAKSHHAKAMALANERTVRGNFNDVQFDLTESLRVFSATTAASS
jgi:hypothetical protein